MTSSDAAIDYLPWDRYLTVIRHDTDRLLEVTSAHLDAAVPSCPGWTARDLLVHVAAVYLHKVEGMRIAAEPGSWPPADLDDSDPAFLLRQATGSLVGELRARDPYEERYTWYDPDQTNGFWYRRMALEIAIHRVDGELAAAQATGEARVTQIDDDIALDGIDEFLRIFVGGSRADEGVRTEHPVDATVRITSAGRSWTLRIDASAIDVEEETEREVGAEIAGTPHDVYLWLWGRGPLEPLSIAGDDALAAELRARFAEAGD